MASIKFVEMENFKIFNGKHIYGPLGKFTVIVGPNGSGKSNFMDAISFAVGEKCSKLRVNRLTDLIYGVSISHSVTATDSAMVTLHIERDDKSVIKFTRMIRANSSEYKIDGQVVGLKKYLDELAKLKINAKAKDFVVYQGTIESIALGDSKQRTELFEQISISPVVIAPWDESGLTGKEMVFRVRRSIERKADYDRLVVEYKEAREQFNFLQIKHRKLSVEKRNIIEERKFVYNADKILNEMGSIELRFNLLKLWKSENMYEQTSDELIRVQRQLEKLKDDRELVIVEKMEIKKERIVLETNRDSSELIFKKIQKELNELKSDNVVLRDRAKLIRGSIESDRKTLERAKKARDDQDKIVKDIEGEKEKMEKEMEEIRATIEESTASQEFKFDDDQIAEYNRLKARVVAESIETIGRRDERKKILHHLLDQLQNEDRKKNETESRIVLKNCQIGESEKRLRNIDQNIDQITDEIESLSLRQNELANDLNPRRTKEEIHDELEDVNHRVYLQREDFQSKKKRDHLKELKKEFPGVKGRLRDLFKPVAAKYNIAVGKATNSRLNFVVVDTKETAENCITFLREYKLGLETFLPLDYILVKETLQMPQNMDSSVKRLIDVVQFNPEFESVVWYVANNIFVCETPEDAKEIAFGGSTFYNAIALDGTYCQKNGMISGGKADLEKKWKNWNFKLDKLEQENVEELKRRRDDLYSELKESGKLERQSLNLTSLRDQIRGQREKLSIADCQKAEHLEEIRSWRAEIADLRITKQKIDEDINVIRGSIRDEKNNITNLESLLNETANAIFNDFCQRNGLENIRQYEKEFSRIDMENENKLAELENQLSIIENHLLLERERLQRKKEPITKWKKRLEANQSLLEECLKTEKTRNNLLNSLLDKFRAEKDILDEKNERLKEYSKKLKELEKEISNLDLDVESGRIKKADLEKGLIEIRDERHDILINCKIGNIPIQLSRGSLDNIENEMSESSRVSSDASSGGQSSNVDGEWRQKVDYGQFERDFRRFETSLDVDRALDQMRDQINKFQEELKNIGEPTLKNKRTLEIVSEKYRQVDKDMKNAMASIKKTGQLFEMAKLDRHRKFTNCLEHVSKAIDQIYKELTNNQSSKAELLPTNPEEPYLGGIEFGCLVPGNYFRELSDLSGGEKSLAALALLFALHSYQETPFIVLDEIDAALDLPNTKNVVDYLLNYLAEFQRIVITHQRKIYRNTDTLLGLLINTGQHSSSQIITLDLSEYLNKA